MRPRGRTERGGQASHDDDHKEEEEEERHTPVGGRGLQATDWCGSHRHHRQASIDRSAIHSSSIVIVDCREGGEGSGLGDRDRGQQLLQAREGGREGPRVMRPLTAKSLSVLLTAGRSLTWVLFLLCLPLGVGR